MEQEQEHIIKLFIKFGKEERVRALHENGELFLNSIQNYREAGRKHVYGDPNEGATQVVNSLPGSAKCKIDDKEIDLKYQSVHYTNHYEEVFGNAFSLYAVSSYFCPNAADFVFDERMKKFGSHFIIIKDLKTFLSRVESALQALHLKFSRGFITYRDFDKGVFKPTLFEKDLQYRYQNEFRFLVQRESSQPLKIHIGSLHDISEVHEAAAWDTLALVPA